LVRGVKGVGSEREQGLASAVDEQELVSAVDEQELVSAQKSFCSSRAQKTSADVFPGAEDLGK
jgi:hypothetical protein